MQTDLTIFPDDSGFYIELSHSDSDRGTNDEFCINIGTINDGDDVSVYASRAALRALLAKWRKFADDSEAVAVIGDDAIKVGDRVRRRGETETFKVVGPHMVCCVNDKDACNEAVANLEKI